MKPRRIIFFGAHPDDPDILFGGTAIKLAQAGHIVKLVSVTNGDTGHHILSRAETVRIRYQETQASAALAGIYEYQVLDHPCGLEVNIANREEIIRIIRCFAPEVVITHRLCDYHPDHRAVAQLVLDTAYTVTVPHYCEDTPIPEKTPVYAHSFDRFQEPRPFRADAAVEIDSVLEHKLALFDCHKSQFYEWLPWNSGYKDFNVKQLSEAERRQWLLRYVERFKVAAEMARDKLLATVEYAEVFEFSPYGASCEPEEFQRLFSC
ncbi:MAG: 1D-myo-inositol 2-acetamido-2-deoxy-alpha-D-glucopyranoside deacetylase [Lentisphaerae bacterium ADurb.Bin242]|nr:MAG: 1D-myo-inositol 2-acetamido-2-deoxy-alpha-D-glucopyranoside deacetylase [Lentisphaerae bacterium ADurb.Bin242]